MKLGPRIAWPHHGSSSRRLTALALAILVFAGFSAGSNAQTIASGQVTVSSGSSSQLLAFGLAPEATDGLDNGLGEAFLPPLPPSGVFDARFIGPSLDTGSLADFRNGQVGFTGVQVHRIRFQRPAGVTDVSLSWLLPVGATGHLSDTAGGVLVSETLAASGSLTIPHEFLTEVDLEVAYSQVGVGVERDALPLTPTFTAYPNPAVSQITVEAEIPEGTLEVFDLLGRRLLPSGDLRQSATISTGSLPVGTVILRLTGPGLGVQSLLVTVVR